MGSGSSTKILCNNFSSADSVQCNIACFVVSVHLLGVCLQLGLSRYAYRDHHVNSKKEKKKGEKINRRRQVPYQLHHEARTHRDTNGTSFRTLLRTNPTHIGVSCLWCDVIVDTLHDSHFFVLGTQGRFSSVPGSSSEGESRTAKSVGHSTNSGSARTMLHSTMVLGSVSEIEA